MEGISQGLHCQNNLLISGLKLRVRDLKTDLVPESL